MQDFLTLKNTRTLVYSSMAIVAIHMWVLAVFRTSPTGILWSNNLQLLSSAIASAAFGLGAKRTQGFVQKFCYLAMSSCGIWCVATGFVIFYESILGVPVPSGSFVYMLYFFYAAPLVASLFIPTRSYRSEEILPVVLDYIQFAVMLVCAFLFFLHIPFNWGPGSLETIRIMRLSGEWRNWVLVITFAARALITQPGIYRELFGRMTGFFLIYATGGTFYLRAAKSAEIYTGNWFDLTWTIAFLVAGVIAAHIPQQEPALLDTDKTEPDSPQITFYLIPTLLPLLIWFMTLWASPEYFLIAAIAVIISFACLAARLTLQQHLAHQSANTLRQSERAFREFAASISSGMGQSFFESLVLGLSKALGTMYVFVGEIIPERSEFVKALATAKHGRLVPSFEYALAHTPCAEVTSKGPCAFNSGVAKLFPEDSMLMEMGVEAYMGAPLLGQTGKPLGLIVVLHDRSIEMQETAMTMLQIASSRASLELQRLRAEKALRASEQMFWQAFKQNPAPSLLVDVKSRQIFEVNDAFLSFYGAARMEVIGRTPIEINLWADESDRLRIVSVFEKSHTISNFEAQLRTKTGRVRSIILNGGIINSEEDQWLLSTFTDVTHSRSLTVLMESERQALEMLANQEPLHNILESIASTVEKLAPKTKCAFVTRNNEDTILLNVAAPSLPHQFTNAVTQCGTKSQNGVMLNPFNRNKPVITPDISEDPSWRELREVALGNSLRSCWSSPLFSAQSEFLGTLSLLYPEPRLPRDEDQVIVMRAASIAVIAIQRSHDTKARNLAEHQRSLLLADLITAEEDERRRIARELHDGTGQTLTSLLLRLRALQHCESLDQVLQESEHLRHATADAMTDLRRISQGLYPTVLDDFGLVPAINRFANEAAQSGGFQLEFSEAGMGEVRLSRSVETALYRMTQEALHNVQKHAQAQHVKLAVSLDGAWLSINITDDGKGFDIAEQSKRATEENRIGLFSLRQRSAWLGGSLGVHSRQGEGTSISIRIPAIELVDHE